MKRIKHILSAAAVAGLIVTASYTVTAQDAVQTTTTSTTNTAGVVSDFGRSTIVIKSQTDAAPMTYRYTKTTTYVDENGQPVSIETVKSGLPVTVYYDKEGDGMVARRVVVRKTETPDAGAPGMVESKTTTTSTAGTISEFDPNTIVVKTDGAEPARYSYTKTTTYVDENGQPVSMETVKSGLPVTVYYEKDGDNMVARKVVVRRAVAAEPGAGTVIEHKKTTTTTTSDQ